MNQDDHSYFNYIYEELKEQAKHRIPYYMKISDFEERLLEFDNLKMQWKVGDRGSIILPTYHPSLNTSLKHLHGGTLILNVSKSGLKIYSQTEKVLRLPQTKRIHSSLPYLLVREDLKIPILYAPSQENAVFQDDSSIQVVKSYRDLFSILSNGLY